MEIGIDEADITINGTRLGVGQAMALRVAAAGFFEEMKNPEALGPDEHGRRMVELYRQRLGEVLSLMLDRKNPND